MNKDIPLRERRWRCDDCKGLNVQVSVPAWFREGRRYEDVHLDTDWEATRNFYCDDCGEEPSSVTDRAYALERRECAAKAGA